MIEHIVSGLFLLTTLLLSLLVYGCIVMFGHMALRVVESEFREKKIIATLEALLKRETPSSKAHEETNHAMEETVC